MSAYPERGHPAHPTPHERHNQPVILLVTVITRERARVLGSDTVHTSLINAWQSAQNWIVGYYMIMPDHIHLFCAPATRGRETVKSWAAYWKRLAGKTLPRLKGLFVWDCWDTQMRNADHYFRKLEYVRLNPVRRGLVSNSEDWPFQGKLNDLPW